MCFCEFPFTGSQCKDCEPGFFSTTCEALVATSSVFPAAGLDTGGGQVSLRGFNFDNVTVYTLRWGNGATVDRVRPCYYEVSGYYCVESFISCFSDQIEVVALI